MQPRLALFALAAAAFTGITPVAPCQSTAGTALQHIQTAFSQGKPVASVRLNAIAEWIAGSDRESGNAVLTANADGSSTVQLALAKGARTETQTSFSPAQDCTWAGSDGVVHTAVRHNCMTGVAWFLPSVSMLGGQQPSAVTSSMVAADASQTFLDLRQQQVSASTEVAQTNDLMTHLSRIDLYLDPASYLPAVLDYNIHPDRNAAADIPVQVTFTDYRTVDGISVPFRIQRYINGVLNLDLTVTQVSAN